MSETLDGLILLPHLRVQNANAVSGPLTWGFPAPSAFTGLVHALQRKLGQTPATLDGVGVVCHRFDPQTYQPAGGYLHRFRLNRQPLDKNGDPPGIVEEGRAHLEVSLLVGVRDALSAPKMERLLSAIWELLPTMRLAGGSLLPPVAGARGQPTYTPLPGDPENDRMAFRTLRRRLLPGFALVHRPQILADHLAQIRADRPQATTLDALLALARLNVDPQVADAAEPGQPPKVTWQASRARKGWLVPLPVGYGAISPLYSPGQVENTRDPHTPFRFVECLYSLGEWLSPHRLEHPQDLLWYHQADPQAGLYVCGHAPVAP